jgi:hypothetical protein
LKVYVVFIDYGRPEGCSEPERIFKTSELAESYIRNMNMGERYLTPYEIKELEVIES